MDLALVDKEIRHRATAMAGFGYPEGGVIVFYFRALAFIAASIHAEKDL